MRKIIIRVSILVVLLIVALFAGLHSFTFNKSVVVNAPIFDVSPQFTNLKNWKNWNSAFSGNTVTIIKYSGSSNNKIQQAFLKGDSYKLTVLNAAAIVLDRTKNSITTNEYISAVPDSNGRVTNVLWTLKIKGYLWLKNKISGQNNLFRELQNLKSFMEDESRKYGFPIKIEPVVDTLILTKEMIAAPGKAKEIINLLYQQLVSYMRVSNIPSVRNYHYESTISKDNGYTAVAVGIPVSKEASKQKGYEFLKLPKQGRLLTGIYIGAYDGIGSLYVAMDKYVMNNKLKKVAQHLEKHQNEEVADSNNVTVEIAYPIY